jgi:uroporphyrin-III C-methyltransferase/precorrin-2 dehydrogenase/sirohydrochlorin ferrochelatase
VNGFVSLVGAGPGDPELLTLRAVARLRQADIVFYDALVDAAALDHAPHARRAFVGKRAGRPSIEQRTIESLLIRHAQRGERVVRLKSGDPFVFGRGGEEALALAAAGVPCEIVPGVSSAIAAPALSGIPLTHRGLASAFLVVSGHAESAWAPVLRALPPGTATLVVLMGLASRGAIAAALLARGWSAQTPAAVLLSASTSESQSWRGTLDELGRIELDSEKPGVLVVGATVDVAAQLERFAAPAALAGGAT